MAPRHPWRAPAPIVPKTPAPPPIEPHLESRLETIAAPSSLPLHERLARAARDAERERRAAEAQCLNSALVALQDARYKAREGVVTTDEAKALVAEIAAL